MNSYSVLLFLHVAMAIVWLGAGLTLQLLAVKAERATDAAEMQMVAGASEWLTNRLFIPASLLVLVFGIALVVDGPWAFDQLWIVLGLAGYAASFVTGITILSPQAAKIERLLAEHGGAHPEVEEAKAKIFLASRIELAVLFAVVLDMVVKPTADSVGFWITAAAGIGVVAALAYRSYSGTRPVGLAAEQPERA